MSKLRVNDLVAIWLAGDPEVTSMLDECIDEPEFAWTVILEILKHDLTIDQVSLLAAGPLENLLAQHGHSFVDRVEKQAKIDPKFNHLLGGVWRQGMPDEIWRRIEKARKEVW